jgi:CDP-4-dehydro-6-deoxyglucose reductase
MSRIRLLPSGHEIETQSGDTVLGALERAGYALDNNCRAGACGECKTKVLAGDFDQGMVLSMALSQVERDSGFGLMCMATPLSEVLEIDYGTVDAKPRLFPPRTKVSHVVVDRVQRTDRMIELRLRPLGKPLRYWPGQYVQLGDEANGVPARCYSLASAPRPEGELVLLITKVEDGLASSWIHDQIYPGDTVEIDGPYGTFVGDPATETPVLCLAAGSGLAPIMSLADAALRRGFPHPVTLVFSARSEAEEISVGLMKWWEKVHPNFKLVITHTRTDGANTRSGGRAGRINEWLHEMCPDLSETSVFIAGSPEFVADCRAAAESVGAKADLMYTEGHISQAISG